VHTIKQQETLVSKIILLKIIIPYCSVANIIRILKHNDKLGNYFVLKGWEILEITAVCHILAIGCNDWLQELTYCPIWTIGKRERERDAVSMKHRPPSHIQGVYRVMGAGTPWTHTVSYPTTRHQVIVMLSPIISYGPIMVVSIYI
jgi:hypothetical protein